MWKTELQTHVPHQQRKTVWTSAGQKDDCSLLEEHGRTFYGNVDAACLALEGWTYTEKTRSLLIYGVPEVDRIFWIIVFALGCGEELCLCLTSLSVCYIVHYIYCLPFYLSLCRIISA